MRLTTSLSIGLAILLAALCNPALAGPAPVVGQVVTHAMLEQGRGIPPGEYRIRWRSASRCLGEQRPTLFEPPYLVLLEQDCRTGARQPERYIPGLPFGSPDWFWAVPLGGGKLALVRYSGCLTRARGVVLGAPRMNFEKCGTRGDRFAPREHMVNLPEDQRFELAATSGPSGFNLISSRDCVVTREGRSDPGADLLAWSCNGSANQEIELVYVGPLPEDLQGEHQTAMDRYYATSGTPRPVATPAATQSGTTIANIPAGTELVLGALAKPRGQAAASSVAKAGMLKSYALSPAGGALEVNTGQSLTLDMEAAVSQQSIALTGPWDRWQVNVPYRFAVTGLRKVAVECELRNAAGQPTGRRTALADVDGPSAGTLSIGIAASSDSAADMASADCKVALTGMRDGIDWEAWTFPETGAPNGWAVWVREAGKSRWWTGASFRQDYSMHFAVSLPQN